jgi:abortive infection bacteriophage resistance protein
MANKASRTIQEQIELLENRGMMFHDKAFAMECLKRISYFRLKAYWWDMQSDPINHVFTNGSCFEDVIERYEFDNALRKILFTAIDTIEIALRTKLTTSLFPASPPQSEKSEACPLTDTPHPFHNY